METETVIEITFLDAAILQLSRMGPLGGDREKWAARVVDDAIALASRRELKLLEAEATEMLARKERGDDCPKCEGERVKTDRTDAALREAREDVAREQRNAAKLVGLLDARTAEIDKLRASPPTVYTIDPIDGATELNVRGLLKDGGIREATGILRGLAKASPPTVMLTDCEALTLDLIGQKHVTPEQGREILRLRDKHTRAASVEQVAKAYFEAAYEGCLFDRLPNVPKQDHTAGARAALRALSLPIAKTGDREGLERENARAKQRLESCAAELKTALEEAADLRSKLALVRTPTDGVWYWTGNGDHPESLVCPVVMTAEQLRGLVVADAALAHLGLGAQGGEAAKTMDATLPAIRALFDGVDGSTYTTESPGKVTLYLRDGEDSGRWLVQFYRLRKALRESHDENDVQRDQCDRAQVGQVLEVQQAVPADTAVLADAQPVQQERGGDAEVGARDRGGDQREAGRVAEATVALHGLPPVTFDAAAYSCDPPFAVNMSGLQQRVMDADAPFANAHRHSLGHAHAVAKAAQDELLSQLVEYIGRHPRPFLYVDRQRHELAHRDLGAQGVKAAKRPWATESARATMVDVCQLLDGQATSDDWSDWDKQVRVRAGALLAEIMDAAPPREPRRFVADREKLSAALLDRMGGFGEYACDEDNAPRLADAAIAEIERQRAEFEQGAATGTGEQSLARETGVASTSTGAATKGPNAERETAKDSGNAAAPASTEARA